MAIRTTDELMAEVSDHWNKGSDSNIYKLIDAFNFHEESMSDLAEQVGDWQSIDTAQGATLDLIGELYDVTRVDSDDDFYRFMIRLKQLTARSDGTINSIAEVVAKSLQIDPTSFQIIPLRNGNDQVQHITIFGIPFEYADDIRKTKIMLTGLASATILGVWLDNVSFTANTNMALYVGSGNTVTEYYDLKVKGM